MESQPDIPWEALVYVTGHINYGGRVTDDLDRRCLMAMLAQYFVPDVLLEGYKFSQSGTYFAPPPGDIASALSYIRSLPMTEEPEVFGMHSNANISFQLQEAQFVVDTIVSIQPRANTAAAGKSPEEIVDALAEEMLANMPSNVEADPGVESPALKVGILESSR